MSDKIGIFAKRLRKNQTDSEKILWSKLRNRQIEGVKFRRQEPIEGYIVDFICYEKKVIIELDGGYHNKVKRKEYDKFRTSVLNRKGFKVLRLWNSEITNNIDGVMTYIRMEVLNIDPSSHPSPYREKEIKETKLI